MGPGSDALAEEQEARRIRLSDGRQYDAMVLESSAAGMLLQVPQGRTLVSYSALAEISTISMQEFLTQAPIRLGLAPITAGTADLSEIAGHLQPWLLDAARTLPSTELTSTRGWQSKIDVDLAACVGDASCLRGLAEGLQLEYLLVPTVTGAIGGRLKIGLTGFVASTGATIGAAGVPFTLNADLDSAAMGALLIESVYTALSFQSGTDTAAVAAELFTDRTLLPEPEVTAPEPEVAEPEVAETEVAETEVAEVAEAGPEGPKVGAAAPPRGPRAMPDGKAIALGFVPIPGLGSALAKDKLGFSISLAGTLATSWASVYLVGRTARTEAAFWVPAVMVPYAINVVFNQVALLVRTQRARSSTAGRPTTAAPRVQPGAAPLISSDDKGRTTAAGASLWLRGEF